MENAKQTQEELDAESSATAFELYQTLGKTVYSFLQSKKATNALEDGRDVSLKQKDFLITVLAFAATESLRLLDTNLKRYQLKDVLNEVTKTFREQLELQLKERVSNEKPPADTAH